MHLEIGRCEHYCAQMTISIPDTIGKCSLEREHPFLTKFVLLMNSCFIEYNATLVKYANATQQINLFCQKRLVFCQVQFNFIIFEVQIVSAMVHDNIQLVCNPLEVFTYFSSTIVSSRRVSRADGGGGRPYVLR